MQRINLWVQNVIQVESLKLEIASCVSRVCDETKVVALASVPVEGTHKTIARTGKPAPDLRNSAMYRLLASFASALILSSPALAEAIPGQAAPAFNSTDITGANVSIPDLAGRTVVLEWTNHGCPFVKKHYNSGNMQDTQQYARDMGAVWISIVSSAPGKQGHVNEDQALELTNSRNAVPDHVILDPSGEIGRLYGAKATPHMYVIAPDSLVAYAGAIDSIPSGNPADIANAENYVRSALEALNNGDQVATVFTPAYGCDVKYGAG